LKRKVIFWLNKYSILYERKREKKKTTVLTALKFFYKSVLLELPNPSQAKAERTRFAPELLRVELLQVKPSILLVGAGEKDCSDIFGIEVEQDFTVP
jgi:hypothetical protein